jgi:hypothetical protein
MMDRRFLFALIFKAAAKARCDYHSLYEAGRIIRRFVDESYRAR